MISVCKTHVTKFLMTILIAVGPALVPSQADAQDCRQCGEWTNNEGESFWHSFGDGVYVEEEGRGEDASPGHTSSEPGRCLKKHQYCEEGELAFQDEVSLLRSAVHSGEVDLIQQLFAYGGPRYFFDPGRSGIGVTGCDESTLTAYFTLDVTTAASLAADLDR